MEKPAAMRLPAVMFQVGLFVFGFCTNFCWRIAVKRSVNATAIVIFSKRFKPPLQINRGPEQGLIKKLTTNGPDQAFYEGV
jgi:hypothetical protein